MLARGHARLRARAEPLIASVNRDPLHHPSLQQGPDSKFPWRKNSVAGHGGKPKKSPMHSECGLREYICPRRRAKFWRALQESLRATSQFAGTEFAEHQRR